LFVNFTAGTADYKQLLDEVAGRITKIVQPSGQEEAELFVSYCWANSKLAADANQVGVSATAQSGLDPRRIAQSLKAIGPVWLDVECLGRGGLFEDIQTGLAAAKVYISSFCFLLIFDTHFRGVCCLANESAC
jgi:hypothetical protein